MSKAATAAIFIDSEEDLSFKGDEDSDFSFDEKDKRKNNAKPAASKSVKKTTKTFENKVPSNSILKEKSINATAPKSKEKTIEETYQKKTQLEHILLRPDTYSKYSSRSCFDSFIYIYPLCGSPKTIFYFWKQLVP